MFKRVLCALAVWSCALAVQAAEEPQWLKDARAREGKLIAPKELKSKDNWFKAKVPAKSVGKIEKVDGSYTVTLEIGGDAPIYCEVVPDGFDMADMLRRTLDLTMKDVEKIQGKLQARTLEKIDAGAYGNVPYITTSWIYRVNDGKVDQLGGVKQIAMSKGGHSVYCGHVELGFTKSFETVAKAFAETLETAAPAPVPYYQEISTAKIAGANIGIAITTLERDADGDTKAEQVTAMLVPGAAGTLTSQDAVQKEWIRPDATMINAVHVIASNGELTTNLGLKIKDDHWVIEGEMQGKPVSEKLRGDAPPGSWVAQALEIRKILATENPAGAEHSIMLWTSDDPVNLVEVKTKVLAKVDDNTYTGRATFASMVADLTLEKATGMAPLAKIQVGPQIITMERVYANGSF